MPNDAVHGHIAIGKMFASEFKEKPQMVCIPVQIIAQNEWAALEWTDPNGYCGCGFFQIINDCILTLRGYWVKLSLLKVTTG